MSQQLITVESAAPSEYTTAQVDLIKKTVAVGCSNDELALFLEVCKGSGLNPFMKQIYAIKRGDKMTVQTGIDGYRLLAARTGALAGIDDATYNSEDDAHPAWASVTVWRFVQGHRVPFTAKARWSEYAQVNRDGNPSGLWGKMPFLMLAKCFSPDTEVLTETGFHRFDRITPNCGRILQVTDHGLEPVYAEPFAQNYSGDMVTLDSDDLNFCVTPNHDMVTTAGKIEAWDMYTQARTRPQHWIPRTLDYAREPHAVSNRQIQLAAAYIADGYDHNERGFKIEVSRPAKVEALRAIGGYLHERVREVAGTVAHTATRPITTLSDKASFVYDFSIIAWLCSQDKRLNYAALLMLNREQARLFVDTLISFDGHTDTESGVRRFYTSRLDHLAAFEMACVAAGYSVSQRKSRVSDISSMPNYYVTISDRDEIPVVRWGREYQGKGNGNAAQHTGLELTSNTAGQVWCVTVPSGVIIVRRNGFSMLCGNCAEALALRKAFPAELSGVYTAEEMDQADNPTTPYVEATPAPSQRATEPTTKEVDLIGLALSKASILQALNKLGVRNRDKQRAKLAQIKAGLEEIHKPFNGENTLAELERQYAVAFPLETLDTGALPN